MYARVDFVSRTTGRVLLSSLLDSAPEGLTGRECQKIVTILRQTKDKLETVCGEGTVRLSIDDYASSVFWYLVFLRPVVFDPDDPWFGGAPWSVLEILDYKIRANKLKEMDLGIVYDAERNWLTLIWTEALKGILEGIEMCPSWRALLKKYEARTGQTPTTDWWKLCARSHSFSVPTWRVAKHGYLRGVLWHRPEIDYDDIVVFDLNGLDLTLSSETKKLYLPTAKRANFAHFYTADKREFKEVRRKIHPRQYTDKHRTRSAVRSFTNREAKKEKYAAWIKSSAAIAKVAKALGSGFVGRRGLFLSGPEAVSRFKTVARKFIAGELRIQHDDEVSWGNVEHALNFLEDHMYDPSVPQEFSIWLKWRNRGKAVETDHTQ